MTEPEILTFGCRLNTYESEAIRRHVRGLENVIIVNTCAVTAEAERQARQAIRRAHRDKPTAKIIVTGCAAQLHPESWQDLPGVVRILGNQDKMKAEHWTREAIVSGSRVSNIMQNQAIVPQSVSKFLGRTRAFVQIQQGCDHRCTFCIIPFARGPSRSVPVGGIVNQVRVLVESGYREVVLVGVDIASWGRDLPAQPRLGQLCRRLLVLVPGLERLRLSSIDPAEIDDDIWELLANQPRFMPYLHLSLQAASDIILKRMKRRHSVEQIIDVVERARSIRPYVAIGADIIAGFPTEDENMFHQSLDLFKRLQLPYLHVFPYSERSGTPAARMPLLPVSVRKQRAKELRLLGKKSTTLYFKSLIGRKVKILLETTHNGHSEEFAPIQLKQAGLLSGDIVSATIKSLETDALIAEAD